jgi:glycosyltransferase involved in cell wall biosynthesis
MKEILVVCNYFAPENEIASIRMTKFTKYLARLGYRVEVLVEEKNLKLQDPILMEDVKGINIHYVTYSDPCIKVERIYNKFTKKHREKRFNDVSNRHRYNSKTGRYDFLPFEMAYPVIGSADTFLRIYMQHDLFLSAKSFLKEVANRFDTVITTYGSFFGHFCGEYLKKINPNIIWVADFRDPVYRFNFNPLPTKLYTQAYERRMCKKSDLITVVSKGMKQNLPPVYREKTCVITNGFDRSERHDNDANILGAPSGRLRFCYTGRMYGGLQDVSVVFKAVKELIDNGDVDVSKIEFHYAGTGSSIFSNQAKKYKLETLCIDHGMVPRDESLRIQNESHLLMVAVWDYSTQPIGGITGKVLEYMSAGKPIIAVINGDLKVNEMAEMVRSTEIGFAYEEANDERDFNLMKKYILQNYRELLKTDTITVSTNKDIVEQYNYIKLTQKLIRAINEVAITK